MPKGHANRQCETAVMTSKHYNTHKHMQLSAQKDNDKQTCSFATNAEPLQISVNSAT